MKLRVVELERLNGPVPHVSGSQVVNVVFRRSEAPGDFSGLLPGFLGERGVFRTQLVRLFLQSRHDFFCILRRVLHGLLDLFCKRLASSSEGFAPLFQRRLSALRRCHGSL